MDKGSEELALMGSRVWGHSMYMEISFRIEPERLCDLKT